MHKLSTYAAPVPPASGPVDSTPAFGPSSQPLRVDILTPAEAATNAHLLEVWQHRAAASHTAYRLYHSPVWWDHLRASRGDDALRVMVISRGDQHICGIVPCELRVQRVVRSFAGRHVVVVRDSGFDLLGSEPLADATPDVYRAMVDGLWNLFPGVDMFRLKSLSTSSAFWRFLGSGQLGRSSIAVPDGPCRSLYLIDLEKGWTSYLSRFNAKQRNDLQRKHRLLAGSLGAPVACQRLRSADDVRHAYADLSAVFARSRVRPGRHMPEQDRLVDAAERGILRAYLLRCGSRPLAYVIGYQALDVFHYSDVGFDADLTRSSPGVVLLYQVIKDVCEHDPVRWFNFGIGQAEYKRRFSNVTMEDATVFLLRKTLKNRLRVLSLRSLNIGHMLRWRKWTAARPATSLV